MDVPDSELSSNEPVVEMMDAEPGISTETNTVTELGTGAEMESEKVSDSEGVEAVPSFADILKMSPAEFGNYLDSLYFFRASKVQEQKEVWVDSGMDCLTVVLGLPNAGISRISRFKCFKWLRGCPASDTGYFCLPIFELPDSNWTKREISCFILEFELGKGILEMELNGQQFMEFLEKHEKLKNDLRGKLESRITKLQQLFRDDNAASLQERLSSVEGHIVAFKNSSFFRSISESQGLSVERKTQSVLPQVRAAFEQKLESFDLVTDAFIRHIFGMVGSPMESYFACYTYLGQSSCSGKSRLLECRKYSAGVGALVNLIFNFREAHVKGKEGETVGGYPLPSRNDKILWEFLMSEETWQVYNLFIGLLLHFKDKYLKLEGDKYRLTIEPKGIYSEDLGDLSTLVDRARRGVWDHIGDDELSFLEEIEYMAKDGRCVKVLVCFTVDEASSMIRHSRDCPVQVSIAKPVNKPLDGGSAEVSLFRFIRRILKTGKEVLWNSPFVFTDTNTRLGNFLPGHRYDPSSRGGMSLVDDASGASFRLFDPFILRGTWNVFAKHMTSMFSIDNWKTHMESYNYSLDLLRVGRPIWGALVAAADTSNNALIKDLFAQISALALDKVQLQQDLYLKASNEEKVSIAIVCVALTIGLTGISSPMHASSLVQKWMAYLQRYDYSTSHLRVCYPNEPVLALAAFRFLSREGVVDSLIQDLLYCLGFNVINAGDAGEFACRLLLLMGLSSAKSKNSLTIKLKRCAAFFVKSVDVRSYIESLFGSSLVSLIERRILNAKKKVISELLKAIKLKQFDRFFKPSIKLSMSEMERIVGHTGSDSSHGSLDDLDTVGEVFQHIVDSEGTTDALELGNGWKHSVSDISKSETVLDGFVSFSHFALMSELNQSPETNLKYALQTHSGLQMPPCFPSIDQCIPVVLQNGDVGGLYIQAKNRMESYSLDGQNCRRALLDMCNSDYCKDNIAHLNLLINVFTKKHQSTSIRKRRPHPDPDGKYCSSGVDWIESEGRRHLCIVANGIGKKNFKDVLEPSSLASLKAFVDMERDSKNFGDKRFEDYISPGARTDEFIRMQEQPSEQSAEGESGEENEDN